MKVDLSGDEALKIANQIRKETFRQTIESKQVNHYPSFWQMLPFYMLVILVIATIVILAIQGSY